MSLPILCKLCFVQFQAKLLYDVQRAVIAYASCALSSSRQNYCTTYRELYAVVRFVKYFFHYLCGRPFLVRSDHSSLKWLKNFKQPEGW